MGRYEIRVKDALFKNYACCRFHKVFQFQKVVCQNHVSRSISLLEYKVNMVLISLKIQTKSDDPVQEFAF